MDAGKFSHPKFLFTHTHTHTAVRTSHFGFRSSPSFVLPSGLRFGKFAIPRSGQQFTHAHTGQGSCDLDTGTACVAGGVCSASVGVSFSFLSKEQQEPIMTR